MKLKVIYETNYLNTTKKQEEVYIDIDMQTFNIIRNIMSSSYEEYDEAWNKIIKQISEKVGHNDIYVIDYCIE